MVEFIFPSKRDGWVYGVRGTVTNASKWTETRVSASGGGGYVPPQVSSTVVQRGDFWVKTADGKEVHIEKSLPVSSGHEVVILWGNFDGNKSGNYLYWYSRPQSQQ
ncbi:hypothetical protein [Rhodoblastus sp.]|uniref:hypothetical protein n=1 Tax=Rhodoblastus sp. TaxID=1962975 RepID=UPI003F9B1882